MPPKRKNKATMAISAVPPKTTPRNKVSEAAKPGQVRRNSLAPSSGRTSRLLPSIPFQMTTRRGAKTASAASSATSGSRRSSINDAAQYQDAPCEIDEDERPAKRSRTSTDSGSPQRSNGSFDTKTPMNGTQTPEPQKPAAAATLKRRRASDVSTQSSQTFSARANGLLTRTQSDVSEQQPRPKRRKTKEAQTEPADQPPELTDASSAPNSPEPIPDVDVAHALQNVLPTNGDAPAKPGRRLPGRRRQPHSDINIEVDLRRQLNLKMSYRSLAKVQKTLLEELSARTIHGLENDADFYKTSPHYKPVQSQLDQRRDDRMNQLHAVRNYRLEQLERVRVAEDHIQREQYINRFRELQDDFLLQCYFRAKQLEREMKGEAADGTDDEDNILPPTYSDEPHHDDGGRIGSKYASRSRAYVEAERELDDDARRKRFDRARNAFVGQDEDADDSIEESSGGFARFSGPARDEAIAHFNLNSIADAAVEVERTPSPQPEVSLKAEVMPNEQAFDLMRLADLSAQQPRYVLGQDQHPQPHEVQAPRPATPNDSEPTAQMFSSAPLRNDEPLPPPNQTPRNSIIETPKPATGPSRQTPQYPSSVREELSASEPARSQPARISTHRIMDILNAEPEAPVYKPREQQVTLPEVSAREDAITNAPRQDTESTQRNIPPYSSHPPLSGMHRFGPPDIRRPPPESVNEKKGETVGGSAPEPPPVDQALMDALGKPSEPPSTPPQLWSRANVIPPLRESDDALRRRDPLQKIKELLDKKSRDHGRDSDRPPPPPPPPETRPTFLPRISTATAAQEGYDPHRPSVGMYSVGPASASAYPSARRESLDHGLSHWNRDRRMSASQIPQPPPSQSPYQSNPPQLHQESSAGGVAHHSPYAPPAGSLPLPPKPPGMPSGPPPVNFRFAHYDPSPHRGSIPGRPPSPLYGQGPHPGQSPMPYPLPYPPPPPYQGGYVPAPGSFQAPPPPPPQLAPFPPLKIHQYGGQPILPANMAPPPSAPSLPFIGQPPPHPPAFSPPQAQAPVPMYEPARDRPHKERPPEPQPRPRRQYRSYHAPGTQFRTYKGPREGRTSGGGSAGSGA